MIFTSFSIKVQVWWKLKVPERRRREKRQQPPQSATMSSEVFFPLALLFSSHGAILPGGPYDINYKWHASMTLKEQDKKFRHLYNMCPSKFAHNELSLKARCLKCGVTYIPPRSTDSVIQTKARKKTMNTAIKAATERTRRENMSEENRKDSYEQDIMRRRKRQLKETPEERQHRLKHEATLKRCQLERAFKATCVEQEVIYTPPQNNDETASTKRARRKLHRQQFTTSISNTQELVTKPTKKQSITCPHKDPTTSCDCNQPPAKTIFAVVGKEGTSNYASSPTSCAKYISENMEPIRRMCYWRRYKAPYIQHLFSLDLDNTQECPMSDIMQGEIWINGKYALKIMHCSHIHATINGGNLEITHYFNPQHHQSCWDWEEKFSLNVVCSSLPSDVIEEANKLIDKWGSKKTWDGHHLYNLLSGTTATKSEFKCIKFEEFSMKEGDPTYIVARDELHNKRMAAKYGPDWRNTWRQIESENKRREENEKKRKYWMCLKGHDFCHENKNPVNLRSCSAPCRYNRYKSFQISKRFFTGCIDGHEICHDGIVQCPSCQDAKRPRNERRWECRWCQKYLHSLTPEQFNEHRNLCSAVNYNKKYLCLPFPMRKFK